MRVFVAGHRGMLGHVVCRYLSEQGCEVITSEHRYSALPHDPLVEQIVSSGCEWVVNALGRTKQKCSDAQKLREANVLFPLHLRQTLGSRQRLVHASSDCVFSGRRLGGYAADACPDADDEYGFSKVLGEAVAEVGRVFVLRTSIIGPELWGGSGLMAWFLRQQNPVRGFTNHIWNGITTLEWSKVCKEILDGSGPSDAALRQVGTWPPVSKFDLLRMISNSWKHSVSIAPCLADESIDRSLIPTLVRPPLDEQLAELKKWYKNDERIGALHGDTRK